MFTDILPLSLEAVTVAFVIVVFRKFVIVLCRCSMYIVRYGHLTARIGGTDQCRVTTNKTNVFEHGSRRRW